MLHNENVKPADQEVALSSLIYSVKLFANILSLCFYKVIESSEIISETEFEQFIDIQFQPQELFLPLSFRLMFESSIQANTDFGLNFLGETRNLQGIIFSCLKRRHMKKIDTITQFLEEITRCENPKERLVEHFPKLSPLVDTFSVSSVKSTVDALLKGEI